GVSVSTAPGQAAYIPLAHRGVEGVDQLHKSTVWKVLKPWLESTQHAKVLQNAKYDTHILASEGIQLAGVTDDTMLQAYVLDSHLRVNMDDIAQRWLGVTTLPYEELCGKG